MPPEPSLTPLQEDELDRKLVRAHRRLEDLARRYERVYVGTTSNFRSRGRALLRDGYDQDELLVTTDDRSVALALEHRLRRSLDDRDGGDGESASSLRERGPFYVFAAVADPR